MAAKKRSSAAPRTKPKAKKKSTRPMPAASSSLPAVNVQRELDVYRQELAAQNEELRRGER